MEIKVFTAFSGYDSQCMALERAGIPYDLVGWSEIDKYAIQAHNAVFPQFKDRNYGDITKIDWENVPDFDLFTYSSPCQDFSKAGQLRGGQKGSGTRSSLLWCCEEAIRIKKPRYALMENVDNLVSGRFLPLFKEWEQLLAEYGYNNYWKVVSAMDFGVPQNRNRVFLVSILDENQYFDFPNSVKQVRELDEYLEDDCSVAEKYFIKKEKIKLLDESDEIENAGGKRSEWKETHNPGGHQTLFAEGRLFL
jgi:DNA (cytosine-5)-methyltransferase 1